MPANWSLVLNVLLLIGVIFAIGRVMQKRRHQSRPSVQTPTLGKIELKPFDDIIAVRKISPQLHSNSPAVASAPVSDALPQADVSHEAAYEEDVAPPIEEQSDGPKTNVMLFLSAKEGRYMAGYELLQTILAAGLRFGEGNLFHLHQNRNGQGPIICTLAAATASGAFDLQNIGAFSVRGLCLFMQASGNSSIDTERFTVMLETAKQLSEDLNATLLDESQMVFSEASLQRYLQKLAFNTSEAFATI